MAGKHRHSKHCCRCCRCCCCYVGISGQLRLAVQDLVSQSVSASHSWSRGAQCLLLYFYYYYLQWQKLSPLTGERRMAKHRQTAGAVTLVGVSIVLVDKEGERRRLWFISFWSSSSSTVGHFTLQTERRGLPHECLIDLTVARSGCLPAFFQRGLHFPLVNGVLSGMGKRAANFGLLLGEK